MFIIHYMYSETKISVGGVCCGINSKNEFLISKIRSLYKNFVSKKKPDIKLYLKSTRLTYKKPRVSKLNSMLIKTVTSDVYSVQKDMINNNEIKIVCNVLKIKNSNISGFFSRVRNSGYFEINFTVTPTPYVNQILSSCLAFYLLKKDGILLHSSAVKVGKKGFAFIASSTGGKSTIVRLIEKEKVLNDEFNVIRLEKDNVRVYGTPFGGDHTPNNISAVLKCLFLIKKSSKTRVDKLYVRDALTELIKNEYLFLTTGYKKMRENLLFEVIEKTSDILEKTDYKRLSFHLSTDIKRNLF